jgi:hypothetical protein
MIGAAMIPLMTTLHYSALTGFTGMKLMNVTMRVASARAQ